MIQEDSVVSIKNFLTEVSSLKKLKHPNLINLVDCNENGTIVSIKGPAKKVTLHVIYIVLELATSGELFDYVALGERFSERVARYFFRQLVSGVGYIHSQGYAHRDLKPENIFFDELFNLKIADFGFASLLGKYDSNLLRTKLGTENYMAPEILMGQ